MKHSLILLAVISCLTIACEKPDGPQDSPEESGYRDVIFDISAPGDWNDCTKSIIPTSLRDMDIVDIFIYKSGTLCRNLSFSRSTGGTSSLTTTSRLFVGDTYDIIAIANHTDHTPPATLDDAMNDLVYVARDFSDLAENGIPMCGMTNITIMPNTNRVNIVLTRLVAQFVFDLDVSGLTHGSLTLTSAKVRQMNTVCPFFGEGRATSAAELADGDLATDSHLVYINGGWEGVFFILENRQGNLLPGNTNPDMKNPDTVRQAGGNPDLCTYIELTGVYCDRSQNMIGEPVTVRFFIGDNACTNFDVNRNWKYKVSLSFSDDISFRSDWKVDFELADTRWMAFEEPETFMVPGDSRKILFSTNMYYDAGDYYYETTGDTECFDVSYDHSRGCFCVDTVPYACGGEELVITVRSWDGRLDASHTVYIL